MLSINVGKVMSVVVRSKHGNDIRDEFRALGLNVGHSLRDHGQSEN